MAHIESSIKKLPLNKSETIQTNGIELRVGVNEHLSRYELQAYVKRKFQYNFAHKPLDYFTDHTYLSRVEKSYSYVLAFCRRIDLPLDLIFSSSVSYQNYPLDELDNFKLFDQLFERYYESFIKLDVDNDRKKNTFRHQVIQIIFKFWLCGYGILPNYTDNCVDNELLSYLRNWEDTQRTKTARFLGYILYNEQDSPVDIIPRMYQVTPLETREIRKWQEVLNRSNSEITYTFHAYTFGHLKDRINNSVIIEYENLEGTLVRESMESITDATWVGYSKSLIDLSDYLYINNFHSIEDCLNGGIVRVMTDIVSSLSDNVKENIKIACRHWLTWHAKTNKLKLNVNRIIPIAFRNKDQVYGKMINYGAAHTLIQVLLDEHCGFFNDNNIVDFRARRACLLELATGQRASEVCILLYKCIHKDNMGVDWLLFHKTKFNKSNKVVATPDIKKWINELRAVAPKKKILISTKEYPFGDNVEEFRLFANQFDEGPYTRDAMQKFLNRIQDKIWGNAHPNKEYFTTHDLRRMHALYMRINGNTIEEIKDQLGHDNVDSQLPYLATKPVEHQEWFKKIQLKGVYKNITSSKQSDAIEIDSIISKKTGLADEKYNSEKIVNVLLDVISEVQNFEIPKQPITPLPTGFPMKLHSCNANLMVNCGHTELHCFGCKSYKPNIHSYEDHKVEVFRYMVLVHYQQKLIKGTKDIVQQTIVQVRTDDINKLIAQVFSDLFSKFNLTNTNIQKLREDLMQKSKAYINKFFCSNPSPSFQEAKEYLIGGY